jgi:hypothetical protein
MQSTEIEFKYAHHTSTTITRENRLTKPTAKNFFLCLEVYFYNPVYVIPSCRIVLELGEDGRYVQ